MPYLKVDAHGQKVPFFWIIWQSRAEVAIFGKKKKKKSVIGQIVDWGAS